MVFYMLPAIVPNCAQSAAVAASGSASVYAPASFGVAPGSAPRVSCGRSRPSADDDGGRQTLEGSFSAVSKPNFASKYAFESSRRDLHNALLCTALQSHFFVKNLPSLF